MARRRTLSSTVRREALMEAGYRCGNPACRTPLTLQIHHIEWVSEGGTDDPENLLALCPNCHSLHTNGVIPLEAIRHWKTMLVVLNEALDRRSADLLLLLHRLPPEPYARMFSADGLVGLAPLISAGFADAQLKQAGTGAPGTPPYAVFQVDLTERGRAFLDSWLEGSDAYRRSLGGEE